MCSLKLNVIAKIVRKPKEGGKIEKEHKTL